MATQGGDRHTVCMPGSVEQRAGGKEGVESAPYLHRAATKDTSQKKRLKHKRGPGPQKQDPGAEEADKGRCAGLPGKGT